MILAIFSFNASRFTVWQGFSFHWYAALLQDRELIESTANSLIIAAASTVLSTILGTSRRTAFGKDRQPGSGSLYLPGHARNRNRSVAAGVLPMDFSILNLRLGMHTVILAHVGFSLAYVLSS